jgi:hypothetical protein
MGYDGMIGHVIRKQIVMKQETLQQVAANEECLR